MSDSVKKRETFYLAGYDPRGARYYYNLYKKEAVLQSEVNGMNIDISSRERTEKHIQSWKIESETGGHTTHTNYHFLEWDDIIRTGWKKSFLSFFIDFMFYFKTYILAGRFIKYSKVSPRQMIGIFFPTVYLLLAFILSLALGYGIFTFIEGTLGVMIGAIVAYGIVYFLFVLGNKLALFWLLRIFVFSGRYVFEDMNVLDKRLEILSSHLAKVIECAKENKIDEILFVSHSVGTILTIPLLEKTLKKVKIPTGTKISILTLGECIPLVSGIDKASTYKNQMAFLASSEDLFWLDYTTVIDGACFPSLNYFTDAGILIKNEESFHFLSPRFHTLFLRQRYDKLRLNKYLTHFIYLMSTDISGGYDYFKITAGHKTLSSFMQKGK